MVIVLNGRNSQDALKARFTQQVSALNPRRDWGLQMQLMREADVTPHPP